jgi:hypothetical protein
MTVYPAKSQMTFTLRAYGAVIDHARSTPHILDWAYVDVFVKGDDVVGVSAPTSQCFRPVGELPPPEDIAGLAEEDFIVAPSISDEPLADTMYGFPAPQLVVAHGASRLCMLLPTRPPGCLGVICTEKLAVQLWPEAPGYALDDLVTWRTLCGDPSPVAWNGPPERAAARACSTATLLIQFLGSVPLRRLALLSAVSTRPAVPPPLPGDEHAWQLMPNDEVHFFAVHSGKVTGLPGYVQSCAQAEKARRSSLGIWDLRFKPAVLPE